MAGMIPISDLELARWLAESPELSIYGGLWRMHLSKLPAGGRVLGDANVMVHSFLRVEPFVETCKGFIHCVANLQIEAFGPADAVGAVIHRVMVAEAITKLGLQPRDGVNYLKSHPHSVKQLQSYRTIPSGTGQARVHILDVTYRELHASEKSVPIMAC